MRPRNYNKYEVARRAKAPPLLPPAQCSAFPCTRPTQRSAGNGLSDAYCKKHVEFKRRHGDSSFRSYKITQIAPYRRAAKKWIDEYRRDQTVSEVILRLDAWIASAGVSKSAYQLRWLSPDQRARQVMARLREAGIPGRRLLEITLTIKATMAELGPRAHPEFQYVQIAKMAHRLNSGTAQTPSGFPIKPKYPRAEGHFMRVLGRWIEDTAALAATPEAVEEVIHLAEPFKR